MICDCCSAGNREIKTINEVGESIGIQKALVPTRTESRVLYDSPHAGEHAGGGGVRPPPKITRDPAETPAAAVDTAVVVTAQVAAQTASKASALAAAEAVVAGTHAAAYRAAA